MIAFPISQERRDPLRGREDQVHDGGRGRGHDPLHDGRGGQSWHGRGVVQGRGTECARPGPASLPTRAGDFLFSGKSLLKSLSIAFIELSSFKMILKYLVIHIYY